MEPHANETCGTPADTCNNLMLSIRDHPAISKVDEMNFKMRFVRSYPKLKQTVLKHPAYSGAEYMFAWSTTTPGPI